MPSRTRVGNRSAFSSTHVISNAPSGAISAIARPTCPAPQSQSCVLGFCCRRLKENEEIVDSEDTMKKIFRYLGYTRKTYEIRSRLNVIRKKHVWFFDPMAWYFKVKYKKRKRLVKEIIKNSKFDTIL